MISALDLKEQYESIKGEIDTAVAEVLESTQFVLGSAVRDLEEQVAAYTADAGMGGGRRGLRGGCPTLDAGGAGYWPWRPSSCTSIWPIWRLACVPRYLDVRPLDIL